MRPCDSWATELVCHFQNVAPLMGTGEPAPRPLQPVVNGHQVPYPDALPPHGLGIDNGAFKESEIEADENGYTYTVGVMIHLIFYAVHCLALLTTLNFSYEDLLGLALLTTLNFSHEDLLVL